MHRCAILRLFIDESTTNSYTSNNICHKTYLPRNNTFRNVSIFFKIPRKCIKISAKTYVKYFAMPKNKLLSENDELEQSSPPKKTKYVVCNKLGPDFYNVDCITLANALLGKLLVRQLNGVLTKGRIVETECYLGAEDKASHSYQLRKTPRNEPMFMDAGTAYVYITYGMYYCMNISSKEPGAAVLLRALEPIAGIEDMMQLRLEKRKSKKALKEKELCNGPSKLCMSMGIDKESCNKIDLCQSDKLWVEDDPNFTGEFKTIVTSRIGIESAGEEWAKKPLRYYILDNPNVSVRDKKVEQTLRTL